MRKLGYVGAGALLALAGVANAAVLGAAAVPVHCEAVSDEAPALVELAHGLGASLALRRWSGPADASRPASGVGSPTVRATVVGPGPLRGALARAAVVAGVDSVALDLAPAQARWVEEAALGGRYVVQGPLDAVLEGLVAVAQGPGAGPSVVALGAPSRRWSLVERVHGVALDRGAGSAGALGELLYGAAFRSVPGLDIVYLEGLRVDSATGGELAVARVGALMEALSGLGTGNVAEALGAALLELRWIRVPGAGEALSRWWAHAARFASEIGYGPGGQQVLVFEPGSASVLLGVLGVFGEVHAWPTRMVVPAGLRARAGSDACRGALAGGSRQWLDVQLYAGTPARIAFALGARPVEPVAAVVFRPGAWYALRGRSSSAPADGDGELVLFVRARLVLAGPPRAGEGG